MAIRTRGRLRAITTTSAALLATAGFLLAPTGAMANSATNSATTSAAAGSTGAASIASGPQGTTVSFRGWTGTVPASWTVVDLTRDPTACVRFDRPSIYVGTPGSDQVCPSHLRGRADAIVVEPSEDAVTPTAENQLRATAATAGVTVTASWAVSSADVEAIVTSARVTSWAPSGSTTTSTAPSPTTRSALTTRAAAGPTGAKAFVGKAFDTCTAPSLNTMNTWKVVSPYGAAGIYVGGINQACSQANLTAGWVSSVTGSGWALAPIYVGRQAPTNICSCSPINPANAVAQATAAADDAVSNAQSLGIGSSSPIFLDMEGYTQNSSNTPPVLAYEAAWTNRLHALGYLSGIYSGSLTGIADLVKAGSGISQPDEVWYANWDGRAVTTGDPYLSDSHWTHRRLHQYATTTQTWGGVTLSIDTNAVDGLLAGGSSGGPPATVPPTTAPPTTVPPTTQPPTTAPPTTTPPPPGMDPTKARAYVAMVFQNVLGRAPSDTESNFWVWGLVTGATPDGLPANLVRSLEWARHIVDTQYLKVLHRLPDAGGASWWSTWILTNRRPDLMAGTLAGSPEYWFASGWDDATFVVNLYRDMLGRKPDLVGLFYWTNQLQQGTPRWVLANLLATAPERATLVVTNAYKTFLGRSPDAAGMSHWTAVYQSTGDPGTVVVPLASSPEAVARA